MEIQKIYSDPDGKELLYSVLMDESEIALFSKMEDAHFRNQMNSKRRDPKPGKRFFQIAGGTVGAGLGFAGTAYTGSLAPLAIGTGLGIYSGRKLGKMHEKDINAQNAKISRIINNYDKASEHDKKYLREILEKEEDRELQREQIRAQKQIVHQLRRRY